MGSNCCKCANGKKSQRFASNSSNSSEPWTRGGKDDPLAGERFSSSTQRGAVTLTVRNASVEDAGRYALTAHNDTGQARSDILLEVRTRPGDVPVFLRRLNDLAVKVGTRTRFLVEIRSPTQVKVSWEQEGKPIIEGERFHLLHEGNFFCVDVAPVTLEDAGLWMCRAHNSNGAATCFCHLNVLVPKAYKAPHFIEELVAILTEQGTVSLECKVVGVPTPTLKWFKDNQEIKAGDVFALSANPQDSTSLGTYTCEATNCMGKAYSTSKVHVINKEGTVQPVESLVPRGPAPVFSKELQNEKVKIGGKLTLVCKVKVPPWPKSISWFNKEGVVESGGRYHIMEDGLGAYSVEVSPVEATDEGQWKCVATSNAGNKTISTCSVSVNYPKNYKKPKFLESLKAILTEEGLVSFECKVVGYPTPQLRWFKDGQELKPGDVYQLTGTNSLGSYCCIAKNCMGETSSTAELTVEDIQSQLNEEERLQLFSTNQPPSFVQGLKSIEVKVNDPFRFTVQVSVSPQPTVSWYRDDEEVQDSDRLKKEQETKGVCHLSFKRLELADQAEWKCVATNDYGQSVTSCFLKLNVPRHFKKPRFLENLRAILSEEGAVNLECKVIGVPQPTLKWYKDGKELKPGDIHRIISGQDGTCCLGTYTCEATNCMGTVASSASLLGFEDRGQVKPPVPRPLPPPAQLVRQPSLSTILEERTSQMHDPMTLDDRAEVSFSFDGKEVSVSLYETPDLTEEEALQVVEMYAEELSEHISEHNVIELPPMRFVKETSKSGNLLMEAVVIDVSPDYYASAEDRTEADLDEFSITEDNNGFLSPAILSPEEMPFEKFTADFLERTLQALPADLKSTTPIKPPRKRGAAADASDSSYHSFKEAKVSTPEEESSDAFLDALSSEKDKSQKESLMAFDSGTVVKEIPKLEESKKLSKSPPQTEMDISQEIVEKSSETKKLKKKSRSRSKSTEIQPDESSMPADSTTEKKLLNKRKSSDSEKEDDSLREFEKRKSLKMLGKQEGVDKKSFPKEELRKSKSSESEKEDDSLQEYENRKSLSRSDKTGDKLGKVKKHTSDESGKEDDSLIEYEKSKMSSDGSLEKLALKIGRPKFPLSKSMSTESSEKDDAFALKSEVSEQTLSRKKRKKSVKKTGSLEKKEEGQGIGAEIPPSSEAESYDQKPLKHKKVVSTSDLDRMRSMSDLESVGDKSRAHEDDEDRSADFDTAEDSAYDKSEMSVLESLNHSLKEIQKGLAAVGEKILSESSEEPQSAKSSLSIIESLVQPISEIQKSLVEVERLAEETEAGHYSPSSILETLKEPIEELSKNLAVLEQTQEIKTVEESMLKKTGLSLLESVSQPLQELHKELSFIQQQAVIETGDETFSEILQSFKPSLLVVEGGMEQSERELTSKIEDLTDVTAIPQSTYAHLVQDNVQSTEQVSSKPISSEQSDSVLPMTVQELDESLVDTVKSLSVLKESSLKEELKSYAFGLEACMQSLKNRAQTVDESEIKDILVSASNLINPLDQFKTVIERCLMLVVENDKSANPQVKSANIVLKSALESPVHALGSCLHLLETLAQAKSNQEVRGLGIKILYKLSFPLEELKTTMKLVENLSEHTCIELLVAPVENLTATVSIINPEASKVGFAENISKEGMTIVKELDLSLGNLTKSLSSMTKTLQPSSSLVSLATLSKPLLDLQKSLHKLENKIHSEESQLKMNKSETHNIAQDLCKPLQAIRTELSLAQHEIELDNFTNLSADVSQGEVESPTNIVNQSLEQVYKSVLTCTEFILSKSPDETLHLRYLLFALNELIIPVNQLNSSIVRSEQILSREKPKREETDLSMQPVTASVKDLLETLSSLQEHSSSFISQPESSVVQAVCAMANPLLQVESGLQRIVGLMHEEDKQILNINLLKTLAEPFKCLQKTMINVSENLESGLLSQEIFLELRQPIQELQRSILVIQDQVSFEYGDEPASIESNIITLQSLVHPMNSLKKHFLAIESLLSEQTLSTSHSKGNKTLHSIIKVSHDLQLKVSSIMVQENYLSKHSLDSLDMFPILQDLSSLLREFENSLKRVDLVSQHNTKPDVIFHNRLTEAVNSFKVKFADLQNKIVLASNKAIKDKKHPVHYLKKGTEGFLHETNDHLQALLNSQLDEVSLGATTSAFFNKCSNSFKELSNHLAKMENLTEEVLFPEVKSGRDSTDISTISSSDTIKDVNTIVEEITQSRVSLESQDIPFAKSQVLVRELQTFCEYLRTAEEVLVENTVVKATSLSLGKEEERKALLKAFSGMKIQLGKVESYIHDNPQALESLKHLKYSLEVVQEHLSFGEEISEMYILQNLSGPLKTFKNCFIREAEQSTSGLKQTESVSMYLERFEKSTSDLELGLMKLEHALLNSTGDFSSLKNIDIDVLAHPIEELVQYIHNIEEQSSIMSETLRDQSSLSMLKTLALPIQEIKEGVLEIQEQILFESSGQPPSRKSCASILYEIAKPIRELRSGVALIQEQVVIMEADLEPLSDETAASSLKTLAVPIEELKRVLETFVEQRPIVFEPEAKSMSEDISLLKTLAQPVKELHSKLAAIEINQLMEGNVETFTVKENLLALAKPIHVLQESIAQFENKIILETLGDDISAKTDISLIKRVAKPLLEIAKGIAMISEQQVIEAADLEDNTLSELSTLANITDVSMESAVLNVNEPVVLEQGLSLKDDVHVLKQAKATREDQLAVAVTEVQQVICEAAADFQKSVKSKEKASMVVEETCSPLVVEQQIMSQIDSFSIDSNSKQLAEVKDVTLHQALQAEIQEPISAVSQLTSVDESLTLVQELSGSLNVAAQVDVQQALSEGVTFVNEISLDQPTKVNENITPAYGVQGELQQSLADVESIETEEDTLKSVSIQETSYKLEPLVQIQQALSIAESLSMTEKTLNVADVKTDLKEALQNEAQQVMSVEGDMKSFDNSSNTAASIGEVTPQVATNIEMQQVMSTVENLQTKQEEKQTAKTSQVALAEAVQVEQQDLISNVESLSEFSISAKQSQALSLEDAHHVAIQAEIKEFLSVAENIRKATEEIKAKMVFEPALSETAHLEIQKVFNFSDSVQSMKENLQLVSVEVPPLLKATKSEVQQVLTACQSIQTSVLPEMKTGIQSEVEQILCSAQSLENIQQSISAKLSDQSSDSILVQVGKEKSLPLSENVAQLDTCDEPRVCAGVVSTEADRRIAVETEIQAFISVAESINTVRESLKAKVSSEPSLKRAVQQEIQQYLSAADEVVAIKNKLEAKSLDEPSLNIATTAEIQQVMSACAHLESAKEALEAKSSTERKLKTAIQSEIQQILATTETLHEVQQNIVAKLSQIETIKLVEEDTQSVSNVQVIDHSSNICQADTTIEVSPLKMPTLETDGERKEMPLTIIPPLTVQTQIDEFIEVANNIKKVSDALQEKAKIKPELRQIAIEEIQQISCVAKTVQVVSNSLQAKTIQEPSSQKATQFEIQEVSDACEELQKATVALQEKVNKNLNLQTAIQSEMQQILHSADAMQIVKQAFTATEKQEANQMEVSKTSEIFVSHVGSSKLDDTESTSAIGKTVLNVVESCLVSEAATQVIPLDDACEILTAVDNLNLVSETLKSIISKEPSLNTGLETQIQQIMLTSDNLKAVKPALANISSEPSALSTVKLEMQQILTAEENLNVITEVLQAKSISEPQLQIAKVVLPQLLQSAQSLQVSCERLQEKHLLDSTTKNTVDGKPVPETGKVLKMAIQEEIQQNLSTAKEVQNAVDSAKAVCTQESSTISSAKKSSVASLINKEQSENETEGKVPEEKSTHVKDKEVTKDIVELAAAVEKEEKRTEKDVTKKESIETKLSDDAKKAKVEIKQPEDKINQIDAEVKTAKETNRVELEQKKLKGEQTDDIMVIQETVGKLSGVTEEIVSKEIGQGDKMAKQIESLEKTETKRKKSKDGTVEEKQTEEETTKSGNISVSSEKTKIDNKDSLEVKDNIAKSTTSIDPPKTEKVNEEKRKITESDEKAEIVQSKKITFSDVKSSEKEALEETSKLVTITGSSVPAQMKQVDEELTTVTTVKGDEETKPKRKMSEGVKVDKKDKVETASAVETITGSTVKTTTDIVSEDLAAEENKPKRKKSKDEKATEKQAVDITPEQPTDNKEKTKAFEGTETAKTNKSVEESKLERKASEDESVDKKANQDIHNLSEKITDIKDQTRTGSVKEEISVEKDKPKRKKSTDAKIDSKAIVEIKCDVEKLTDSSEKIKSEKVVEEIKTVKIDKTVEESKPRKKSKDEKVDKQESAETTSDTVKKTDSKDETKTKLVTEEIDTEKDKPKRKKSKDAKDIVEPITKAENLTDGSGKVKSEEVVDEVKTVKIDSKVDETKPTKKSSDENVDKKDTVEVHNVTEKTTDIKDEIKSELVTEQMAVEKDKPKQKKSKDIKTEDTDTVQVIPKTEQLTDSKGTTEGNELKTAQIDKNVEQPKPERKNSKDEKIEKTATVEVIPSKIESSTTNNATQENTQLSKDEDKVPKRRKSKQLKVDKKDVVEPKSKEEEKIIGTNEKQTDETFSARKNEKEELGRKRSQDLKSGEKGVELDSKMDKSESTIKKVVSDDYKTTKLVSQSEKLDSSEEKVIPSTIKLDKNFEEPLGKSTRKSNKPVIEDTKNKNIYNTEVEAHTKVYDREKIEDKFEEKQTYLKSEMETSTRRSRRQNRLYIDESSTSDYSSESCSESLKIKKSTSYDRKQWEKECLKTDSKKDSYSSTPLVQHPTPKKYESPAVTPLEKITYQRREQTESKPLFCGRLVDRTAALGSKVKVTCSLVGKPDPTVQWYKDGLLLNTSEDLRLHTSLSSGLASLEISELKLGDAGRYTCMARNKNGEASTTASIKIFSYLESTPQAPVFSHQIKDQYKSASDELTVECRVKGSPQPVISWYKDEQLIPARSRFQQTTLADGTCRLVIHGPEPNDSGQYKCVAENEVLSETISGYVLFEGREKYLADIRSHSETKLPRFTNIVTDHRVREGGTVALQVAIKGTTRSEVTWYRGSEPLPKKSSRFRYLEDSSTGVYSLVMSDTSRAEAGIYTCRASNAHGYRDHTVKVEVVSLGSACARGRPAMFVTRPDTSLSIAVGEDIGVSFRVSGDPKPQVTWMKNMKDITNNIRTMKETVNDYVRLSLNHANVMDAGTYFMMAKNVYGTDYAFVTVKVKQRARSLTPTGIRTLWSAPETSTILRDIHEVSRAFANELPGRIEGEATVSDSGKNWLSLTWAKPENRGAAPILAYRVEAWRLGSEGGAQWSELGITPINSFDAFFLQPGGEYKFRITPRNRYGWGESVTNSEPITVGSASNFAPDILRDLPGPVKALQGDSFTLDCEIAGDPRPDIEWMKDGLSVNLVKSLEGRVFVSDSQLVHRLIIKQLTADDSGRYVCEATNKLGKTSTCARLLVVSDPCLLEADKHLKEGVAEDQELAPQFTMRLRDRRVQTSYPVRLSCQVVGNPAPTVTWACDNQPITSGKRYQLLTEADHFYTLEISPTELGDIGEYMVTAQNPLGAVSCRCQLTVDKGIRAYIAPYFTSQLEPSVSVRGGAELRLFAQVEAYPSVGIAWQKDGVRLRPSRRLVVTVDPDGRVELALAHMTSRDAGTYTCTASNIVGRAETSCQVNVTGGTHVTVQPPVITSTDLPYSQEPKFVVKPRSTEAVEGDTVIISCEVVGDPQPEVMWLRDWLKPDYYRDSPQFRQVAGGAGAQYTLEIPQVKLDFTGTYCVIARNPHGEAKAIISLQIYAKGQGKESSMVSGQVKHGKVETLPEIKRGLKDLRCCDGDSATLECLVCATPPPSVRWEKDGRILPLGEDVEAEVEGELARLRIRRVYPEDEGQYSCVAYNSLGRAVTSACLVVDVPEEKEHLLSQQLTRPTGFHSALSTPRSTPRNTPSPGRSLTPLPSRFREFSSPSLSRAKRIKMASPKFYTVPHNRIAEEGETVRFQCAVAGHPIPWASWDKDGHIVTPGARLSVTERDDLRTLELREVTVDDAGLYRVTLENEMGSIEATARLDVIGRQGARSRSVRAWSGTRASPTFGRRLVGSAARVGGTFTLSCDVQASPSPVTSWYRNGEMVVMTERAVPSWDGRVARLELRDLKPEDGGVYTCVAENCVGTTQCAAELQVLEQTDPSDTDLRPPVFLQGLQSELTVEEGQPLELQTRLQGSSPLEVVWVKDGVEIPDCEDFRYVDYGDGRFGLRIADLFMADAGLYNCEAFNDHGDAITSGHLIVLDGCGTESPRTEEPEVCFTKTPSPVMAPLRGNATFCARLQSRPLSHTSFTWSVSGHSVASDNDRFKVTNEEDSSILEVRGVQSEDVGPVTCVARVCSPGVPPSTVSCSTQLTLDSAAGCPATLLRGPSDTTAMRGDRVLLKAIYRGNPEPSVRWLKAGRELQTEGRVQINSRDGVSCLTISAITADDSGKYVVSVENLHGADCHYASVAVEGPPEPPAGRPSVAGVGDAVTVAWSSPAYDGGCVLTGYQVEMRTSDSQDWRQVAERCHSLSHVVRGLEAGQTYLFRVRAENIHGASESSIESFPFTFHTTESKEEEPESCLESRQVSLEPGEEFLLRYSVHEELGKGRYGVVNKVTDLHTGQTLAAKFVRCIKKQDREKVQEEIDIMNCLRHPKLLQLTAAFENPKDIVMVMEYISGGELFERVVADDFTLTERDCILFLRQICEGVSYMHKNNVVHLDLKPENIMCHTRTSHRIKIIDFGLAQKFESNTPVRVLFGTPEFIPPEIINYEPIGTESDMWSVGVICYVLLSGLSPFMGDNDAETFANITRADYDFDDEAFDAISQDAKDFISSLLLKRQEKRLTADECLRHKWMTQCDTTMNCIKLSTDKLKKFIIRRKWQKTGNAIRALGRMATLSAASRRNSHTSSVGASPRQSLATSRMSSLGEGEESLDADVRRARVCSERSDSGISDCSSITPRPLQHKKYSICEEPECESRYNPSKPLSVTNKLCASADLDITSDISVTAKKRSANSLRPFSETTVKAPSPTLQKDAKVFAKNENFQKAFAFWKQ